MKAGNIFFGTMIFNFYKLAIELITAVLGAVTFGILVLIGRLFGDGGIGIAFILWLVVFGIIRFVFMHYIGYMIKAGHIAVISRAVTEGKIPADQVNVAKAMVKERFVTANIYFAVDKLVSGAVRQVQGIVDRVGGLFKGVPGVDIIFNIIKLFIGIALGYVDECCLGYTFYKKEEGAFKSAADGVVIYAQNWKTILKNAAGTTLAVVIMLVVCTGVIFALIGGLFSLFNWSRLVAFIISALLAYAVKYAFIDSWILVKTMSVYMDTARSTTITYDLYGKLCGISKKFKELFDKGAAERPAYTPAPEPVMAGVGANTSAGPSAGAGAGAKSIFCGECGAKNEPGTKFCSECGAKLG